jgi:DsbC/DsbD-like thiol-disulfide interchange protein
MKFRIVTGISLAHSAPAAAIRVAVRFAMSFAFAALMVGSASVAAASEGTPVVVKGSDVIAQISLSADHASAGHQVGVAVNIAVAPGWHIYGEPLPEGEGLTPTSIKFDSQLLARQTLNLPKPTPLRFEILNQTYPVYTGNFKALGNVVLNQKIKPGDYSIPGTFNFQLCNDSMCKPPQAVRFELPIKIDPSAPSAPNT